MTRPAQQDDIVESFAAEIIVVPVVKVCTRSDSARTALAVLKLYNLLTQGFPISRVGVIFSGAQNNALINLANIFHC